MIISRAAQKQKSDRVNSHTAPPPKKKTNSMESRVLLKNLTVSHLVKKFLKFYGTRKFIQPLVSILTNMNPVHNFPPYFPNAILPSTTSSSDLSFPFTFTDQNLVWYPTSYPKGRDKYSHPYKTTRNIMVLYILMFKSSDRRRNTMATSIPGI
jgi:hypothetical protein